LLFNLAESDKEVGGSIIVLSIFLDLMIDSVIVAILVDDTFGTFISTISTIDFGA